MTNTADKGIVHEAKKVLNRLKFDKDSIHLDAIINTLNNYLQGTIKISNPLNIAENLHNGHYVDKSNISQLWTLKRFYELLHYNVGLIDIGRKFLSDRNYHGAFESFHSAKYSQGLLDMTKEIVDEVKKGNRNNIGYAKKALTDIILFEGKEYPKKDIIKQYINTIADAYIMEYKHILKNSHQKDITYLYEALGLYNLNNNLIGIAKTTAKIAYHKITYNDNSNTSKMLDINNNLSV